MPEALFVLSTGRCGTQWLASLFERAGGDLADVRHEPLGSDYAARQMLAAGDPARLDSELAEPILAHIDEIERVLDTRSYIECGHPAWSTMPYLISRFPSRLRVVHLVRHPVPTAWSWVTQLAYCPPMAPHFPEKVLLSPFDEGPRLQSFRDRWQGMNAYEKALYYWAEVNAFALKIERETDVPWMRLRFEDLARQEEIERLIDFAGLDAATAFEASGIGVIDEYRAHAPFWCDSGLIRRHPEVVAVAEGFGYDPADFDDTKLRRRYYAR
ncbi:MAG TPA: hypothetical protein VGQ46_01255 [Thermoanaerobaculia bacterium]|jgi:hypothetical protein|nr:hypothetical protein [Thermoanaerobaculia bacterium]